MKVGIWFQPTVDATTVLERIRFAEKAGFDFVGITDGQMIWRDAYVCLALGAHATSNLRMGPWVTNPITRHITATANAICTLDELSNGRAFLGIGIGDDSVHTIGSRPATIAELTSDVQQLRHLLAGRTVARDGGQDWTLSTGRDPAPPVYWAAAGPRSLHAAGASADGAIHSGWLVPELMAEDLTHVADGVAESGRDPGDVATIFNTAVAISDDREMALDWATPYAARAFMYPSSVRVPGWDEDRRRELEGVYDYYGHFRSSQGDAVPRDLIHRKAVVGTADEALELIQMVADAGYTHAALTPMGDVDAVARMLAEHVLPRMP